MSDRGGQETIPPPIPEDPIGLIGQAVAMGEEFPGPAEDVLLSWILKLAPGIDASEAAQRVIEHYGFAVPPDPAGELGRLVRLLRQTAACPPEAKGGKRRRGGRSKRP